jgi:WD40 repeat protein
LRDFAVMPTTRTRRAAARAAERQFLELPADVLSLVLYQLPLAHDIAAVAPTCRLLCDAAKLALKLRPFSSEVVPLFGHISDVNCVTALTGCLLTGSEDETVKFWRDGACVRTIHAHTSLLWALAVLPGGARFISGANDHTAKLWTLEGVLERTFAVGSNVLCVAVLPDGVHFVIGLGQGDNEGDVRLYHVDGTLVHTFKGRADSVYGVAVTPDGQHILSGGHDRRVKVWSVATKSLVSTCIGHTNTINVLLAMPDGQRILSGSDDKTVRVWLLDGTHQNTFSELHTGLVWAVVALPDNQHALSASTDATVKLFNVNDGTVLRTFAHHARSVYSLALLPDGLRFISGSSDQTARIVYHGLACKPDQAWIDSKPKRDKLRASAALREELSARIKRLNALEADVANDVEGATARLDAEMAK